MDWQQYLTGSTEITQGLSSFLFTSLSVIVGIIFIYRGIKKIVDHGSGGNPQEKVFGYIAINFATGAALIQFSFFIDSLVESLFGQAPESPSAVLGYLPSSVTGTELLDAGIEIGAMWVSVIGVISILRGFILWNSLAHGGGQQNAGWKGLWHIVFGVLAANIAGTIRLFFGDVG